MVKNLVLVLSGAVSVVVLMVACGDDDPAAVDAAVTCACDPSEPPLAGRIVRVEDRVTAQTFGLNATAVCASGATLLGGGCFLQGTGAVRLIESGDPGSDPAAGRWSCAWINETGPQDVTVVAWATCLMPAP